MSSIGGSSSTSCELNLFALHVFRLLEGLSASSLLQSEDRAASFAHHSSPSSCYNLFPFVDSRSPCDAFPEFVKCHGRNRDTLANCLPACLEICLRDGSAIMLPWNTTSHTSDGQHDIMSSTSPAILCAQPSAPTWTTLPLPVDERLQRMYIPE